MIEIIAIIVALIIGLLIGQSIWNLRSSEENAMLWDENIHDDLIYNEKRISTEPEKKETTQLSNRLLLMAPIYARLKRKNTFNLTRRTDLALDLSRYKRYASEIMLGLRQLSAYKTEDVVIDKEAIRKWQEHVEINKAKMDEIEKKFKVLSSK